MVGLITYDAPHRKTADVCEFLPPGDFRMFALPFTERRSARHQHLIAHRPPSMDAPHTSETAARHGIRWERRASWVDIRHECERFLVLGAGLLSPLGGAVVVNCHGGIIPAVRGLDSFKWAIHDDQPLGVTLHLIDESVDMGEVIGFARTPVRMADSLASLAQRHYRMEVLALAGRIPLSDPPAGVVERPATRRMNKDTEVRTVNAFDDYRARRGCDFRSSDGHVMAEVPAGSPDTMSDSGPVSGYVSLCRKHSCEFQLTTALEKPTCEACAYLGGLEL